MTLRSYRRGMSSRNKEANVVVKAQKNLDQLWNLQLSDTRDKHWTSLTDCFAVWQCRQTRELSSH